MKTAKEDAITLSEKLKYWRTLRPDTYFMDIMIEDAIKLENVNQPLPIESAPKDGTVIDIFSPSSGRLTDCNFDPIFNVWKNIQGSEVYICDDATHWLPIPQVKGE